MNTTPQKAKHSPLPWNIFKIPDSIPATDDVDCEALHDGYFITDKNNGCVTEPFRPMGSPEDAKFICLSVNNHAALVEALKNVLDQYESVMHSEFDFPNNPWSPERDGDEVAIKAKYLLSKIEAES